MECSLKCSVSLTRHKEKGAGTTADPKPGQVFKSNCTEVLRTLLMLFSKQIYVPLSALFIAPLLCILHFVQHTPRRDVLMVLCWPLNMAMNAMCPAGSYLMGGIASRLLYNHLT